MVPLPKPGASAPRRPSLGLTVSRFVTRRAPRSHPPKQGESLLVRAVGKRRSAGYFNSLCKNAQGNGSHVQGYLKVAPCLVRNRIFDTCSAPRLEQRKFPSQWEGIGEGILSLNDFQ